MIKQRRTKEPGSNIYINKFYFPIPDFTISKSIDFITLNNIDPVNEKMIYDFLENNNFRIASDVKLEKGNYHMMRTYSHDHGVASVEIFHGIKDSFRGWPSLSLTIHDPNRELLALLDSFFNDHGILPNVSQLELTMDLFTDDIVGLYEFLKSHLFMKGGRTILQNKYVTGFYLNNIRKSKSKGMKVYLRPKTGPKEYVRVEITLKRRLIKRLGLEITLNNVESIDLRKFFIFGRLDEKAILDYLIKKSKCHIERLEKRKKGSGHLLKRLIVDISKDIFSGQETLMEKVNALKLQKNMIPQHNRFLKPLNDFSDKFFQMVSTQNFLPARLS